MRLPITRPTPPTNCVTPQKTRPSFSFNPGHAASGESDRLDGYELVVGKRQMHMQNPDVMNNLYSAAHEYRCAWKLILRTGEVRKVTRWTIPNAIAEWTPPMSMLWLREFRSSLSFPLNMSCTDLCLFVHYCYCKIQGQFREDIADRCFFVSILFPPPLT